MLTTPTRIAAHLPHAKNPDQPNPEPTTPDTGYLPAWLIPQNPLEPVYTLISKYPWIILILIIGTWWGIKKLWEKLSLNANIAGKPFAPLPMVRKRTWDLLTKEDIYPVIQKPEKLAAKLEWLTWKRWFKILILITLIHLITPSAALIAKIPLPIFSNPTLDNTIWWATTALIILLWLALTNHIRKIVAYRHFILMQMFEVAASEMRYDKGSELNPWGYIQINEWTNVYTPGVTRIMYPPKYRAENIRNQEAFERGFNATTSDQHTWTYEWEPTNNCVTATPTPYIPANAPYPFPDTSPWNEIPLGEAAGGETAVWDLATFPHALVAGTTGSGKLAKLNTRIPVPVSERFPDGWATFGTIQVGDELFDEKGNVCKVVGLSDINEKPDLYEVEFSDGTVETVDGDHLWWTETRQARESKWNTRRKPTSRTPLLSDEQRQNLKDFVVARGIDAEVTIREIADVLGVCETSSWLRDLAAHVGPVGEVQIVAQFEYAEQEVVQRQKVRCFREFDAWKALSLPPNSLPSWFVARGECSRKASEYVGSSALVDKREVASVLGLPAKKMNTILSKFSPTVKNVVAAGGSVDDALAVDVWRDLGSATSDAEQAWLKYKDECVARAEATVGSSEWIPVHEVRDVVFGEEGSLGDAAQLLKNRGVGNQIQIRDVVLQVPNKIVERKTGFASTYLLGELSRLIDTYGQKPVNDQRWRNTLGAVRTTSEIRETLRTKHGHANHAVPVTQPVDLPEQDLPIDPHLLGIWLGDGFSREGKFCGIDHQIAETLAARGHTIYETIPTSNTVERHVDFRRWEIDGLLQLLRENNLLQKTTEEGSQKHIPAQYLRASIQQRRDLLAGLLDTDGTVAPQGTVVFTNTNEKLAYQVRELAVSLGYKATITEGRSVLVSPDGTRKDYGPKWDVSWTCKESPFYLDRKTTVHQERNGNYSEDRNGWRYIVDVRPARQEPGRCIMVDSPSRLFLVGDSFIPTHNSVTQRTILMHVLQSPMWRVGLIDPKRVELSQYESARNVMKIATELEDSTELLEFVEQMMQKRYKQMQEEGVNHFTGLSNPPPAFLLMVDETFALLAPENIKSDEGKERDALHARCTVLIGSIARLGRAAGIHMILATQRPDAKIIPGEVRANLDCRIAQGRMDSIPSMMVLDSDHATRISGEIKGRAVLRTGNDYTEFQAYFLPENMIDPVVEMSNALASGDMSPEDFLGDDGDYLDGDDLPGGGGRLKGLVGSLTSKLPRVKLPHIPMPEGVRRWVGQRKETVASRNAELERLRNGTDYVDGEGFGEYSGSARDDVDVDEALEELERTTGFGGGGKRKKKKKKKRGKRGGESSGTAADEVLWGDEDDDEEGDGASQGVDVDNEYDSSGDENDGGGRYRDAGRYEAEGRDLRAGRRRRGRDRHRDDLENVPSGASTPLWGDESQDEETGFGGEEEFDLAAALANSEVNQSGGGQGQKPPLGSRKYSPEEIEAARNALEELLEEEDFLSPSDMYPDGEEDVPVSAGQRDGGSAGGRGYASESDVEVEIDVEDLVLVPDEYFGTTMGELLKESAETGVPVSAAALLMALNKDFGLPAPKNVSVSTVETPVAAEEERYTTPPWEVDEDEDGIDEEGETFTETEGFESPLPGATVFPHVTDQDLDDIQRRRRGETPSEMWQRVKPDAEPPSPMFSDVSSGYTEQPEQPEQPVERKPTRPVRTPKEEPKPDVSTYTETNAGNGSGFEPQPVVPPAERVNGSPFGTPLAQIPSRGETPNAGFSNPLIPDWAAVVMEEPFDRRSEDPSPSELDGDDFVDEFDNSNPEDEGFTNMP